MNDKMGNELKVGQHLRYEYDGQDVDYGIAERLEIVQGEEIVWSHWESNKTRETYSAPQFVVIIAAPN